jgi:hypothetical protein
MFTSCRRLITSARLPVGPPGMKDQLPRQKQHSANAVLALERIERHRRRNKCQSGRWLPSSPSLFCAAGPRHRPRPSGKKCRSIEAVHAFKRSYRAPARRSTRTVRQPPAAAVRATIKTSTTGDAAEIGSAADWTSGAALSHGGPSPRAAQRFPCELQATVHRLWLRICPCSRPPDRRSQRLPPAVSPSLQCAEDRACP